MKENSRIRQISNLLKDLSSNQVEVQGVPISSEKELDMIFEDMRNQNYRRYNKLFEKLQSSKISIDYLKSIFRGIVDMVIILKPDGTIYKTNLKVCEVLGFSESDLIQMPFQNVLSKKSKKTLPGINERLKQKGFINNIEQGFVGSNGQEIPVLSSLSLLKGESKTDAILYIVKDISKIKEVEKKLRTKNEELNTFVYKASHDIKGPLASILGLVSLAKSEVYDPKEVELYIDLIGRSVNRLDYTLCELLEFTKIGQGSLNYSLINFKSLLRNIVANLEHLDNYQGLNIEIDVEGEAEFLNDETVLRAILQNLIQNAVNFRRHDIPDSYISIKIQTSQDKAIIKVQDNGEGMKKSTIEHIFKMFYRGNERTEGSGLGLYIVKTGLEKIEGKIEVESKTNKGSIFTVTVPNLKHAFQKEMKRISN